MRNEKLNWECWYWERMGFKGVVGSFITHLVEMLIFYSFGAFIFCLELTALGYRWRIVLIVVDNAWGLGKLKLIEWTCHGVWLLSEYINFMYWLIMYTTYVYIYIYICCFVWTVYWKKGDGPLNQTFYWKKRDRHLNQLMV